MEGVGGAQKGVGLGDGEGEALVSQNLPGRNCFWLSKSPFPPLEVVLFGSVHLLVEAGSAGKVFLQVGGSRRKSHSLRVRTPWEAC